MPTITNAAVDALMARAAREIDDGTITAAQLTVALNGEIVAARSFGTADDGSRFIIFSATKALDGVPANRTIAGYVTGSEGYHRHRWMPAASAAFGHHGAGGQLCWVEPHSGLSFCFLHDTLHQDPRVEFTRSAHLNDHALAIVTRA